MVDTSDSLSYLGLVTILGLVLLLPFSIRWVEEELEVFLLAMGSLAVTISWSWSEYLIQEALFEPIKISLAVLVFGFLFRALRQKIGQQLFGLIKLLGAKMFLFLLVVALGLLSSVITAIIAALVLVEVISSLKLEKNKERAIVILSCYSIGLGAALTPIGEPLSTIVTAKLSGPPYHADFFFLARLLWHWIIPGIMLLGVLAGGYWGREVNISESLIQDQPENTKTIVLRAVKVYIFVAALVLLGHGFTPLVDRYLVQMPSWSLYWINSVSAVLDNATLAAAEISPKMSLAKIQFLVLGLLISGGMLIPGNIPNIISANKLGIKSREWARFAVPLGVPLMVLYFVFLLMAMRSA